MSGEILKNAFLSSDADKSLWSSYKWYGAGINKVNLSDENTDKASIMMGLFLSVVVVLYLYPCSSHRIVFEVYQFLSL